MFQALLQLSSGYHVRPAEADYPRSCSGAVYEETLWVYRELHPLNPAGVTFRHDAGGPLDALGPNSHGEACSPAAYLDRNPKHLKHLSFILFAGFSPSTASKARNTDSGIGH